MACECRHYKWSHDDRGCSVKWCGCAAFKSENSLEWQLEGEI